MCLMHVKPFSTSNAMSEILVVCMLNAACHAPQTHGRMVLPGDLTGAIVSAGQHKDASSYCMMCDGAGDAVLTRQ